MQSQFLDHLDNKSMSGFATIFERETYYLSYYCYGTETRKKNAKLDIDLPGGFIGFSLLERKFTWIRRCGGAHLPSPSRPLDCLASSSIPHERTINFKFQSLKLTILHITMKLNISLLYGERECMHSSFVWAAGLALDLPLSQAPYVVLVAG